MPPHSRDGNSPELCIVRYPLRDRGRREDRVTAAPGALVPEKLREGRVTTGTGGNTPAFPAQWFTAYFALSPVNQLFATVIGAMRQASSPTWRLHGRARTTRLRRPRSCRSSVGTSASTATRPAFRDDRDTPLCNRGGMHRHYGKSEILKRRIFLHSEIDRVFGQRARRANRLIERRSPNV
jgi:hypothetical protein